MIAFLIVNSGTEAVSMNQIEWGRGLATGLMMGGLLVGVVYGQTPGGQAPAGPPPSAVPTAQSTSPDKVVLRVGDEAVTEGELDGVANSLTADAQKKLATQGRRSLGDQYALIILLSQDALNHHLDSTPAFQRMLAMARRQLLAQAAFQEVLRQSTVTPEEISKYYAAHQSEFDQVQIRQVVVRKKAEGAKEGTPGLTAEEAKTRAEEIRKALSSGEDPKKVAERFVVPNVIRVDVEPLAIRRGTIRADMDKAAFELHEGQVSDVYDLVQSLVFFQVVSRKSLELKEASSQVENSLRQQKVDNTLAELKKNAKIWMDESYFAAPTQPPPEGTVKPSAPPEEPKVPR
jgi:hypothetical protein